MAADPALEALIRPESLLPWLDRHAPQLGDGPLQAEFLHGGTSNTIIALDRGGRRAVLRRPPFDPPPNSEQAMMREATVLKALNGTAAPHPELFGLCEDEGVIGAPFYVMALVEGWAPKLEAHDCSYQPPFEKPEHKREMAFALTDALAALAMVDYRAVGLGDFGRPEGFLERQVRRWRSQLDSYPERYPGYTPRDIPGFAEVQRWLEGRAVPVSPPGIVHGDVGPPNVLFGHETPARVAALIDWELATIGDPLMDIMQFAACLRDERAPDVVPSATYFDSTDYPTGGEVLRRYAEVSGRDVGQADYYMTLSQFRLACILEYKVAASTAGSLPASVGEKFGPMVLNLMADAHKRIRWAS